jgi:hypothetical protein
MTDIDILLSSLQHQMHLLEALDTVKGLLSQIKEIEANTQMPAIEKLSEIKKIRAELNKVSTEIDTIKNSIKLLSIHLLN